MFGQVQTFLNCDQNFFLYKNMAQNVVDTISRDVYHVSNLPL